MGALARRRFRARGVVLVGVAVVGAIALASFSCSPRRIRFGEVTLTDPSAEAVHSWAAAVAPVGTGVDEAVQRFAALGVQVHQIADLSVDSFTEEYAKRNPSVRMAYMSGAPVEYWLMTPLGHAFHQFYVFADAQGRIVAVQVQTTYTGP